MTGIILLKPIIRTVWEPG